MAARRPSSRSFYLWISVLMLAIVTYGFSRTVGRHLVHSHRANRTFLAVHGIISYVWMLLFVVQCALVRVRRIRLHRLLGWFTVADGVLILATGLWITATLPVPNSWFRLIGLLSMLGFGIPFGLAIQWRRQPERHRRLLLIATAVLTNAAFARFPRSFDPAQLFYLGTDLLIVLGIAHDLWTQRSVHPVYRVALPLLLAAEIAVLLPIWHQL